MEQARLTNTVTLAAERPTLRQLVQARDWAGLSAYLLTFRGDTTLDTLYVSDASGQTVAGEAPPGGGFLLTAQQPIEGGAVSGGFRLDEAFAARLAADTDLTYRFVPFEADAAYEVERVTMDGEPFYAGFVVLKQIGIDVPAVMQIDVPLTGILAAEQQSLIGLLLAAVIAAAGTALTAGLFVRSRMRALGRLSAHARRMGSGDLQTPVEVESKTAETYQLGQVLEQTRVKLRQNLETLAWSEALIQSVLEGIITCDQNWRVRFFSAGAERITGLSSEAALNQPLDALLPLADESGRFSDYVPSDGGRRTVVVRSGGLITLAVTRAKPINAGEVTLVIHDITEETRRHKAQSYFLANMSHEFRTPLAGLQASVELLQENLRSLSVDETEQLLNSIHLSLSMLHQLIDNLLESSKLEANHFALNRRASAVEPLLGEAIRLIEPMIARRDQRLTVEEPLTLPTLRVDPTRTIQAMVNLLSNASKYSPDGSVIEVAVARQDEQLRVSVADRGRGITPEKQSSIFLPFVRLEPESQVDHGSGLGLSVVKAIAEAHQGQVGVEARAGGGSVFWFTLPILEEARGES